ncbi:hypothetical protein GUITHDRAFT_152452 [Guillardia theta CCMP2712]|uniref:Uncharacterized protein n=1 Tax=Guillardia theta (strain CCMP2712) TaxID=905079 RepID=L1JDV2_GUITC|nr:hypothetical protein GUITHDRAFT_152452 [Guillardia theta CCMP2712]EKX46284.1 hypothetical protein GUITHDRAFT_152452 [Guillardia theta CCMP2712]|eukprot:XP_005833264.1 hypothetical protein GUITHDRAFT_152452 [Guillardia theta CCMP2712]
MPDSTCYLLAGFSLLQSAFPMYYAYSWAHIDASDANDRLQNTSLYKVFSTYVGVLWLLTVVNIFAPLIGIGDDKGQRNLARTIAFLLNLSGGLAVVILGIWIIAAVFPTTACAELGLKAPSSRWACTAYHIISWMDFFILCLLALLLILSPCLIGALKGMLHSMLDTAGARSIFPDGVIDALHRMLPAVAQVSQPKSVEEPAPVLSPQPMYSLAPVSAASYPVLSPVVTTPGVPSIQPVAGYQPQMYVSSIQ